MQSTHQQAVTLARQGEFAHARDLLQQLHAVNPHDTAILYDYALCLSEMGDKADSIPLFQHLIDFAPDHVNGRVALGVALDATARLTRPTQRFRAQLNWSPTISTPCVRRARSQPVLVRVRTPNVCYGNR